MTEKGLCVADKAFGVVWKVSGVVEKGFSVVWKTFRVIKKGLFVALKIGEIEAQKARRAGIK
jgi:hypothetical protein